MPKGVYQRKNARRSIVIGDRIDRLEVIRLFKKLRANGYWRPMATVVCQCGNIRDVAIDHLNNKKTHSCGCLQRESFGNRTRKHGLSSHPGYSNFIHMIDRCCNPNNLSYHDYGGRGITICDAWNPLVVGRDVALRTFLQWFDGIGGKKGLTVERVDVNNSYYPGNCTLIPNKRQPYNTRRSRWYTYNGETKLLAEWARDPRCLVAKQTLSYRLSLGMNFEKALTTPPLHHSQYRKGHHGTNPAGV
jgi:hypothetical protein